MLQTEQKISVRVLLAKFVHKERSDAILEENQAHGY
jgi:hypothetical protein